jgi:hypothetical protein
MRRLKVMTDPVQWSLAESLLEQAGIAFRLTNEQFTSLYPGIGLGAFQREILVEDEDYDEADAILRALAEE